MWTEDDRRIAVERELYRREACPQCGTAEAEWLKWQPAQDGDDRAPYLPEARRCWGCVSKHEAEEKIPETLKVGSWVALLPNPRGVR